MAFVAEIITIDKRCIHDIVSMLEKIRETTGSTSDEFLAAMLEQIVTRSYSPELIEVDTGEERGRLVDTRYSDEGNAFDNAVNVIRKRFEFRR